MNEIQIACMDQIWKTKKFMSVINLAMSVFYFFNYIKKKLN